MSNIIEIPKAVVIIGDIKTSSLFVDLGIIILNLFLFHRRENNRFPNWFIH
jgi:cytoskeletal protein CcmA (bactofilin family)